MTSFLALGDSYTIGEGVAEAARWPVQLAQALGIAAPEILARTGWTTDELGAAMAQYAFHPPYDLVSLLIGVNNQYRGRDLANYRDEFRALLDRAIELAGGRAQRVIVVSIPDWGVTRSTMFGSGSITVGSVPTRSAPARGMIRGRVAAWISTGNASLRSRASSSSVRLRAKNASASSEVQSCIIRSSRRPFFGGSWQTNRERPEARSDE